MRWRYGASTRTRIVADHPSEAQHWYDRAGKPMYEIMARNGQPRPTTLADARNLDLVPSVTAIIRCAAAPGLVNWQIDQGIMAALTLPRSETEAEADWLARVKQDAQEQARAAAERGTAIHAEIERYFSGATPVDEASEAAIRVGERLDREFGIYLWDAERSFAHPLGFGGKADLTAGEFVGQAVLLDIKTKDPWPEDFPPKGFDEHAIQLAAYRVGLGLAEAECGNVFVSRQEPWQVHIHRWSEADMQRGWAMFVGLLRYWQAKNKYEPSWAEEDSEWRPF